jgi:hypothetical protein
MRRKKHKEVNVIEAKNCLHLGDIAFNKNKYDEAKSFYKKAL